MLIDLPLLPVTGCRSVQTSVGCKQRWIEQGVEQENVEEIFYEVQQEVHVLPCWCPNATVGFEPLPEDHLLKRCPCRTPESWQLFMLIKKMIHNLKHNCLVGNIIWWDLELNSVVVSRVGLAFHLIARRRLHIKTLGLETNIGDYFCSKEDSH